MPKVSNTDIYNQDENLSMEDYLLGTNNGTANKKTQTYSLGSIFSLFYNFLGFNAFLNTIDTTTYPIGTPGCFYVFDENDDLTSDFALSRKITFSATDTYNFNVASYFDIIVSSNKFLFKLINLEDKNNFVFLAPSNFVLGLTGTTFEVNVDLQEGLSNGTFVSNKRYLLVLEFASGIFNASDYDLTDFTNTSVNPFATLEDVINSNTINSIIIETGFTLIDQDLTINSGWNWRILSILYTNASSVVITIPFASSGNQRIDLIVANQSNTFERIAGTESVSNPTAPAIPSNKIAISFITVTDGVVGAPSDPILGTQFKKKTESLGFSDPYLSGTNAVIQLRPEGNSRYAFSNPGLISIDGFGTSLISGNPNAEAPYDGKDLFIVNTGANAFTLIHDGTGLANSKFFFIDETNLVIPSGGKVWLKYGPSYCEVLFKSWGGETTSLQQVTDDGNTTTNDIKVVDDGVYESFLGNYAIYSKDLQTNEKLSIYPNQLLFDDSYYFTAVLPRTQTQNTVFYFEDEGGTRSIATREWVNANLDNYLVNITTPSPNHTGTSAETNITSYNFVIPANTLSNGDTLRIENLLWEKIGVLNASTCRVRLSNTNNFATASQVAIFSASASNIYMRGCRTFNINSGLLRGVSFTANGVFNDFTLTNLGFSTLALDFTQPIYGFISLQPTNPADIVLMRELKIRKI